MGSLPGGEGPRNVGGRNLFLNATGMLVSCIAVTVLSFAGCAST